MLKDKEVQLFLGIALGIQISAVIAGFLGWIPWPAAAFALPVLIVLFFAIPMKILKKNVYTLSVGFWIAVGMILVPLVAGLLNLGQHLGWLALVWLVASVVAGILWPLPNAWKLVDENRIAPPGVRFFGYTSRIPL